MPASLRYGLPLAVLAVLVAAFWPQIGELVRRLLPSHARLRLLDHRGEPLRHARLQFFAKDTTRFGPSPTRMLGETELDQLEELDGPAGPDGATRKFVELGREHMPEEAFVRVTAPGHGVGFRLLQRGKGRLVTLRLGKPMSVPGTVRSASGQPIEGARVLAIGGGSRGVLLREVRTDKAGVFTIPDLSSNVMVMVVRVLVEGYGVAERTWWKEPGHRPPTHEEKEKARLDFRLRPVPPVNGRVLLPPGLVVADSDPGLEIRVYQLPGVSAEVREDGSFTLHHLAKEGATIFRLLVANLPERYTHPKVLARPGEEDVTLSVCTAVTVTGHVVRAGNGLPVTGGLVSHEHGPRGGEQCRLDADGWFLLERVPPGDIELRITLEKSKQHEKGGVRLKTVQIKDQEGQQSVDLWVP